jgi:hypothetical protein
MNFPIAIRISGLKDFQGKMLATHLQPVIAKTLFLPNFLYRTSSVADKFPKHKPHYLIFNII